MGFRHLSVYGGGRPISRHSKLLFERMLVEMGFVGLLSFIWLFASSQLEWLGDCFETATTLFASADRVCIICPHRRRLNSATIGRSLGIPAG